jgi:hypothetical protein
MTISYSAVQDINKLRSRLKKLQEKLEDDPGAKPLLDAIESLDKKQAEFIAVERQWPPTGVVSFATLNSALGTLLVQVDNADAAPTKQARNAFSTYSGLQTRLMTKWEALNEKDLGALNVLLQQRQLPAIRLED